MDKAQVILQIFVRVICWEKYWVLEKGKSSHRSCQSCASPPRTNRIDPDPIICPFKCEVLSDLVYCSYIHITPMVKTEVWIPWNLLHIKSWAWTLSRRYSQTHPLFMMTISMKENIKQAKGNEWSGTKVSPPYHPIHDVSNRSPAHNPSPRRWNCHIGMLHTHPT
jgi:hypothetical protein